MSNVITSITKMYLRLNLGKKTSNLVEYSKRLTKPLSTSTKQRTFDAFPGTQCFQGIIQERTRVLKTLSTVFK